MKRYIVAASKPWNRRLFEEKLSKYPGRWFFIGESEQLTLDWVDTVQPRYIFFLHWSWKVPRELLSRYECVGFHMTALPYGRGGSPLQNLILRGHRHTTLTAFRMNGEFDAGPLYLQERFSLDGLAEEIYIRVSNMATQMIKTIIRDHLQPHPQVGKPTVFSRRTPRQSAIPVYNGLERLFDFIRMLDAEGYSKAFLVHKGFRYEFSRPAWYDGRIIADVKITPQGGKTPS